MMRTFAHRPAHARRTSSPGPILSGPSLRKASSQTAEIRHILGRHAVQPKLMVSEPNDAPEQEADRVAEEVMRIGGEAIPSPGLEGPMSKGSCACDGGCSSCRGSDGEKHVADQGQGDLSWRRAAPAGGKPLSPELREFYEPRFGRDFSGVRIHTGQRADAASRAINARAFTLGRDIAFARGEYRPGTSEGRQLLAHELAHVGQQGADKQIRRAVACGEECPERAAGEVARSRSSAMWAAELGYPPGGYLVWDFAVGSATVKADLAGNADWADIVHLLAGASGFGFEILGFSDCEGGTERNESLRSERAAAHFAALPPLVQARIVRFAGAPINDCLTGNRTESDRRLNRSAWLHLVEQTIEMEPEAIEGETQPIYICTKPLDTSPYGNHAFFRIGFDRAGSPTISLQPSDFVPGVTRTTCIQGEKGRNYSSDVHASGTCFLSSVSHACLEREYAAYPTGHYCTWGPNSNTFVGDIARACGETREPADAVPGWDDSPPPAGTYAPNRYVTLAGCSTIFCREGEGGELEPYLPSDFEPGYLGGGAYMDERGIVWQGPGPKI